jgi:hypothetical protein
VSECQRVYLVADRLVGLNDRISRRYVPDFSEAVLQTGMTELIHRSHGSQDIPLTGVLKEID